MSSKAEKLKGKIRVCEKYNLRWHDFTLQKNHLFGIDERGYFVTSGKPMHNQILVYRAVGVPVNNPNFYRWIKTFEPKGSDLYEKVMLFKAENPDLKIEFLPLEKEKRITKNGLRRPALPKPIWSYRIPGGTWGENSHLYRVSDNNK